jgi:hypothetical protein
VLSREVSEKAVLMLGSTGTKAITGQLAFLQARVNQLTAKYVTASNGVGYGLHF